MKIASNSPIKNNGFSERQRSLDVPDEWNSTTRTYSKSLCVHELFENQALLTPDAIAVVSSEGHITYKELDQRSNQLARLLLKRGVKPNTYVGISLERSLEMIVGIYGILKSGAAYVPIDPVYPRERLSYMVETAKISILLTQECLVDQFGEHVDTDIICLDTDWPLINQEESERLEAIATPSDIIYLIFTSGSTGQPKAAAVYHKNFTNLIEWFVTEFDISKSDRNLLVSSLSFDLTQKNIYAPLIRGGTLHLPPSGPYDPLHLLQLIHDHGITMMNCTPSAFYPLIELIDEDFFYQLSSMRIVYLGGEPISIPRLNKWLNHSTSNCEVANTYGPTECTDICGFYRLTTANMNEFDFVPLGRPIYNVQLIVVDEELQPCLVGESGELCIGGAGLGAGYINDPEMTADKFVTNPFEHIAGSSIYRTGDQVRWLQEGVLEYFGRLDHQIKIRGFRVELHEIESVLNAHPEVREAVVVVRDDGPGEENMRLVSYILVQDGIVCDVEVLRNYLSNKIPAYMVPSAIYALPLFPLSPNGKVDRNALKNAPEPVTYRQHQPDSAPQNNMERQVHSIWSSVLGTSNIGLDDNFFDVGGNSIQLAQIHVHLQTLVDREFPITDLIVHPNIRAIAACFVTNNNANNGIDPVRKRAQQQKKALMARRKARKQI